MVGSNKILTVSYGTFSCTLEGFDEPFNTMKAIAEYFRDLAADDRYFGAEPPTPDAEMLHRIAEREVQRRVEAKINEHGVVLRQAEPAPAAPPMPVAVPAVAAVAPVAAPVVAEVAPVVAEVATLAPAAEEPVAEEVQAAEAATAEEPVEEPGELRAGAAEEEFAAAPEIIGTAEDEAEAAQPEPVSPDAEEDAYEVSLDAIMEEAAAAPAMAGEASAPIVLADAEETPEPDSVAAKLARIRAVVDGVRNGAAPTLAEAEDEAESQPAAAPVAENFGFALDMAEDAPELIAAEAARAAARAEADAFNDEDLPEADVAAEPEPVMAEDMAFDEDEDIDAGLELEADFDEDLAEAAEARAEEPEAVAAPADADEPEAAAAPSGDAELLARLSELGLTARAEPRAEAQAAPTTEAAEDADDDEARDEDQDLDAAIAALADDERPKADAPEAPPSFFQRARARVIRLSKVATILGQSNTEEPPHEAPVAEAAAEPDMAEDPAEIRVAATQDDDPDVARLMQEAKSKLEGAESRRRFSAISHLKAAVAATLADRQVHPAEMPPEPTAGDQTDIGLYRDDLSKAVRPRRPTAETGAATPRPSLDMRPAPLVLVSEQRVDRPDGAATEGVVVRPRRVATGNLAVFTEAEEDDDDDEEVSPESASSFADFAGRLGATTLTDLLEAAAVYTASVEGRPHFTRPQILRKVEFVSTRSYNREDGLRSFGTLLRQGKIQKISRGQFAITGSSRFMSEARHVH